MINRRSFFILGAAGTVAACAPRRVANVYPNIQTQAKAHLVFSKEGVANVYTSKGDLVIDGTRIAERILNTSGNQRRSSSFGGGGGVGGTAWDSQLHWTNGASYSGWMASADGGASTALYSSGFANPVRVNGYLPLVASAMALRVSAKAVARTTRANQPVGAGGTGDGGGGDSTPSPDSTGGIPFSDGSGVGDDPSGDLPFSNGGWDQYPGVGVDGLLNITDSYGTVLYWTTMIPTAYGGNVPTMSPSQWGECNRALRRMFVDGGLAIGAAVGIAVATGGLGVGVAAWIYAFSAAQLVLDRMEVDRVCGPGSPYYNPSTYGR